MSDLNELCIVAGVVFSLSSEEVGNGGGGREKTNVTEMLRLFSERRCDEEISEL